MDNTIIRGGSWVTRPQFCRSAFRYVYHPDSRFNNCGFRICCSKPPNPFKLFLQKMYKIIRGGGWYFPPQGCRLAYRYWSYPVDRNFSWGFRIACRDDIPGAEPISMVQIPAGSFKMGSDDHWVAEAPAHSVEIPGFHMSATPITQAQWRWVAGLPRVGLDLPLHPSHFKGADRPVEQVNWYEAMEFCARLSAHTGAEFTLPSESQWEYACRAGTTTAYHFGDTLGATQANCNGSGTCPVGYYPANAFGLHDMHGNVWEWCLDDWRGNYEGAPTDGSAWVKDVR
jgi:formylglycine-generating enzyme required for sulfatase activity